MDKEGYPLIREAPRPDFLVHIPGQMTNLLVMEVTSRNADRNSMVDDLKKLTTFRRDLVNQDGLPANYHVAYFSVYGISPEEWPQLSEQLPRAVRGNQEVDRSLIFTTSMTGLASVQSLLIDSAG